MKIIISPAKKMNVDTDIFEISGLPEFMADAKNVFVSEKISKGGVSYAE